MPDRLRIATAPLLALLLPVPAAAQGQEPPIALSDDPFQVTSPRAAAPGAMSLAAAGFYNRSRIGSFPYTVGTDTTLTVGVARNLDLRFGATGDYGGLEGRRRFALGLGGGSGEGSSLAGGPFIGSLYQVAEERGALPAIGVLGYARVIYGPQKPDHQAEFSVAVGKTLLGKERPLGVNLNLGAVARLDPADGQRPNLYFGGVAVGQTLTHDTALVASYVRQQQSRGQLDLSVFEVGVRHRLAGSKVVLGLVAGAGLNRSSPRFDVGFALLWQLSDGKP